MSARRKSAGRARHEALEQAVFDAPDDDGPRLVYADWLQAQGDPRGELAAVQHALGDARGPGWAELKCRELELFTEHGRALFGPLMKWPKARLTSLEWRCGFVDALAVAPFNDEAALAFLGDDEPSGRFVRVLDGARWPTPLPRALEALRTAANEVEPVLQHPRLQHLALEGDAGFERGPLRHQALQTLESATASALHSLPGAALPSLQTLALALSEDAFETAAECLPAVGPLKTLRLHVDALFDVATLSLLGAAQAQVTELALSGPVSFGGAHFPLVTALTVQGGDGQGALFEQLDAMPALDRVCLPFPSDRVRYFRGFAVSPVARRVRELAVRVSRPAAGLALTEGSYPRLEALEVVFDPTFSLDYLQAREWLHARCWSEVKRLRLAPAAIDLLKGSPMARSLEALTVPLTSAAGLAKALRALPKLTQLVLEGPRQFEARDFAEVGALELDVRWAPRVCW